MGLRPREECDSYSSRRPRSGDVEYRHRMTRRSDLAREYWFELLIAVMAVAAMLELVVRRNSPAAPSTPLWLSVPAVEVLVLPLILRRRFPFAAPALFWLGSAALTFANGWLVPFVGSLGVVGLATAFLLGNLRDERKAWVGLAIVIGCILVVVDNIPTDSRSATTRPSRCGSSRPGRRLRTRTRRTGAGGEIAHAGRTGAGGGRDVRGAG